MVIEHEHQAVLRFAAQNLKNLVLLVLFAHGEKSPLFGKELSPVVYPSVVPVTVGEFKIGKGGSILLLCDVPSLLNKNQPVPENPLVLVTGGGLSEPPDNLLLLCFSVFQTGKPCFANIGLAEETLV